jgi:hypothetical protein
MDSIVRDALVADFGNPLVAEYIAPGGVGGDSPFGVVLVARLLAVVELLRRGYSGYRAHGVRRPFVHNVSAPYQ